MRPASTGLKPPKKKPRRSNVEAFQNVVQFPIRRTDVQKSTANVRGAQGQQGNPVTVAEAFSSIQSGVGNHMNLFAVQEGVEVTDALEQASTIADCVRKQLDKAVCNGDSMDVYETWLLSNSMDQVFALLQSSIKSLVTFGSAA